ncbi:FecR family protein [Membranihabitans maritimus]|uniref:FecR family protein n=1 Tax=Membranihabitans maritimus TaxID=2904244 RepID=UPI001F30AA3A|nr:FecR domain-containing protein [Membranihabitans maritimus]
MKERRINIVRFEALYNKYQENTISTDELEELLDLSGKDEVKEWIEDPLKANWGEIGDRHPLPENGFPEKLVKRRSVLRIAGWSVAASLAVLLAASIWFWNRDLGWEEYSTGNGETLQIELSDNSEVLLNANSTIRWNADWEKVGQREVELTGEAFFDIAHMDNVPLEVESENASIQVLGTSFNVREDVLGTDVYLYDGKIKLGFNSGSGDSTQLLMTSGDRVIKPVNSGKLEKYKDVSKAEAASWTEGELKFIDQPLGEILTRLEGIYGKQFEVEDTTMLDIPMDVGVPYANWEVMKSALELSLGAKLEQVGEIVKLKK